MNASRSQKTLKPNQCIALLALASGERPRLVAARAGSDRSWHPLAAQNAEQPALCTGQPVAGSLCLVSRAGHPPPKQSHGPSHLPDDSAR